MEYGSRGTKLGLAGVDSSGPIGIYHVKKTCPSDAGVDCMPKGKPWPTGDQKKSSPCVNTMAQSKKRGYRIISINEKMKKGTGGTSKRGGDKSQDQRLPVGRGVTKNNISHSTLGTGQSLCESKQTGKELRQKKSKKDVGQTREKRDGDERTHRQRALLVPGTISDEARPGGESGGGGKRQIRKILIIKSLVCKKKKICLNSWEDHSLFWPLVGKEKFLKHTEQCWCQSGKRRKRCPPL